ncbi:T9SS type A sorting domain-containing protein [uncultured Polaribacter sp.]|uniref:T9SS type A sorting domain-containing protein n=1 Tax=uncultured Polaribacter sp. TaxID=174711 RepID=UPI002612CFBD|nr:T9SS type A sorting domain-containing protein [uncultured Polaribacter sp.]
MKKNYIVTSFLLLILLNFNAQEQNSNWYFGHNAGLDFSTNPTSILMNGQITTLNKSAAISDELGNLLFYTDGKTVWNKNHSVMQNGNQTLRSSATNDYESVVILPIPNSTKYYIFTEEVTFNDPAGFFISTYYFSIVNMSSNNGLGNVETLNKVLLSSSHTVNGQQNYYFNHHNMTSALHSDGQSYWLILNPTNNFYSFHITSNVFQENPSFVSSTTTCQNVLAKSTSDCTQYSTKISLKSSPTSDKLALIENNGPCLAGSKIDIYNFNNSTGLVDGCSSSNIETPEFISLEFSANGDYLYVLKENGSTNNYISIFDVSSPLNSISNLSIANSQNNYFPRGNSIQRGIDGDLYFLDNYANQSVSVIQNSDTPNTIQLLNNTIVFNNSVGQFPKLIPYNECRLDLTITKTIDFGEVYIKSAQNTITATNSIHNGGLANYDAGATVFLKPGFHAKSGASFRAFIEGCSSINTSSKSASSIKKQAISVYDKQVVIFPNPTIDNLYVQSNGEIRTWNLFNYKGQLVIKGKGNVKVINTQKLSKGIYLLKVTLNNGKEIIERIIKN